MTGKADFKALARSVIADLTRMIIKAQMAQALGVLLGGFGLNPAATGGGDYGGTGGGGPTGGGSRSMVGLQHGGEVIRTGLAVVHKGETYSGVGKSLSNNIDVRIHNEGSEKLEISHVENYMLSDQRIIDVTARAMKTNLSYKNNMRS